MVSKDNKDEISISKGILIALYLVSTDTSLLHQLLPLMVQDRKHL
jgi:hypothetical protein